MVEFNVNSSRLWNCLSLVILFSIFMMLLFLDSPQRISNKHKIHSKLLTRQLKNVPRETSTTASAESDTDASIGIDNDQQQRTGKEIPWIYVITPTYYRLTQMAELTRLSNTLRQVKNLHWIVVEDWIFTNHYIHDFLVGTNISFSYLPQPTNPSTGYFSKGIDQRNAALDWIMKNHIWDKQAVVYFADDDNSYDLRIFEEMRYTKKISMWPVGLSGERRVERPIVKNGKVVKFKAWWTKYRTFPVDMAGFAINVDVLWNYHPMTFDRNPRWCCMQESSFIEQCCTMDDIEPLADNCTKVYVWHTRTEKPNITEHFASYNELYV